MRVLITTDLYAPAVNGVVISVLNLKKQLENDGHEVKVVTLSPSIHSKTQSGVSFVGSLSAGFVYPGVRFCVRRHHTLVNEIANWKPDIIHSQCEFTTFRIAKRIAKRLNVPIVHTYHTVYEDYTHYFFPNKKIGRKIAVYITKRTVNRSNCVIAPTEKVRDILEKYKTKRKIFVIPTGIDLSRFTEKPSQKDIENIKEKHGVPKNNLLLVYIGRLAKEKNISELLKIHSKIPQKDITLMIVGGGPEQQSLMNQAEQLNLGNKVIFTGMVPPNEVPHYYHAGDIFVNSSTSETQGLTYAEALASGLPMLCHKDQCIENLVINGKNGWQYSTEQEYIDCLNIFYKNEKIRPEMGEFSRSLADQYSIETFGNNVENVYNEFSN